ncbi:hypothetical protein [Caballeronia mineralivorans]|uniref:hypothetical protein n=1 Tax=Caballeronia mineralivorans TaxID=2010198 RepID=UPI0023EFEBEC|nr:hypothetical protein [Caballeronia mineralivorans]MDB5789415.1 hypothetical protein [Caballeronia mineralivorans]
MNLDYALVATIKGAAESAGASRYFDWVGVLYDAEWIDQHAANTALFRMMWNGWDNR